jgi:hypothetical protein
MGLSFWTQSVGAGHPLAQEPEGEGSDQAMNYQTMGWGEGTPYNEPPVVDRFKWLDSRFMMNVCDRWNQHKGKQPLQLAYFNGGAAHSSHTLSHTLSLIHSLSYTLSHTLSLIHSLSYTLSHTLSRIHSSHT